MGSRCETALQSYSWDANSWLTDSCTSELQQHATFHATFAHGDYSKQMRLGCRRMQRIGQQNMYFSNIFPNQLQQVTGAFASDVAYSNLTRPVCSPILTVGRLHHSLASCLLGFCSNQSAHGSLVVMHPLFYQAAAVTLQHNLGLALLDRCGCHCSAMYLHSKTQPSW